MDKPPTAQELAHEVRHIRRHLISEIERLVADLLRPCEPHELERIIMYFTALLALGPRLDTLASGISALPPPIDETSDIAKAVAAAQAADQAAMDPIVADLTSRLAAAEAALALAQGGGPNPPGALAISTTSLADATMGAPYTGQVSTTGGVAPVTTTLSGLPDGLTSDSTGAITGTPTTAGSSSVSVSATDSASPPATVTSTISLNVAAASGGGAPTITTTSISVQSGAPSVSQLTASGGTPNYSFSGFSDLADVIINADGTVNIGGATTESGTITATVMDSVGVQSAPATIAVTVL